MYRDAKEELKRLEEALLEESEEPSEAEETEDVWVEEPDDYEEEQDNYEEEEKPSSTLLTVAITLAAGVFAVLIFWFIRYGRVFL